MANVIFNVIFVLENNTTNHKVMKAKINKSDLMRNAWSIYKKRKVLACLSGSKTIPDFVDCLRDAWKDIKAGSVPVQSAKYLAGVMEYYNGAGSERRYFGD